MESLITVLRVEITGWLYPLIGAGKACLKSLLRSAVKITNLEEKNNIKSRLSGGICIRGVENGLAG